MILSFQHKFHGLMSYRPSCFCLFVGLFHQLDYAAKKKSAPDAEKYYAETVSTLNDVLAKLG